jgi:hypothetical protein
MPRALGVFYFDPLKNAPRGAASPGNLEAWQTPQTAASGLLGLRSSR